MDIALNSDRIRKEIDLVVSVADLDALEPAIKAMYAEDMHAGMELLETAAARRNMYDAAKPKPVVEVASALNGVAEATSAVETAAATAPGPAPRAANGEAKVMLRIKADSILAAHTDVDDLLVLGAPELKRIAGQSFGLYEEFEGKLRKRYAELANGRKLPTREAVKAMGPRPSVSAPKGTGGAPAIVLLPADQQGLAQRLLNKYPGQLMYAGVEGWFKWSGIRWLPVKGKNNVHAIADEVVQGLDAEVSALMLRDAEAGAKMAQEVRSCRHASTLPGTMEILATKRDVARDVFELDSHSQYLGTESGPVDLFTGKLCEPDPTLLITNSTACRYDPEAKAPRFLKALSDSFGGRRDDIEFFEHTQGYSILGDPIDRVLVLHCGRGSNGKSMIVGVIGKTLGTYTSSMPSAVICTPVGATVSGDANGPTSATRRLINKRYVISDELPEGGVMKDDMLKKITGYSDLLTARGLKEEFIEFLPICVINSPTNAMVSIRAGQEAAWGRILPIWWKENFAAQAARQGAVSLERQLADEAEGILAWLVRCAMKYRKLRASGKNLRTAMSQNSVAKLQELRDKQNPLNAWLTECCVVSPLREISSAAAWQSYCQFMDGERAKHLMKKSTFLEIMAEKFGPPAENLKDGGDVRFRGFKGLGFVRVAGIDATDPTGLLFNS